MKYGIQVNAEKYIFLQSSDILKKEKTIPRIFLQIARTIINEELLGLQAVGEPLIIVYFVSKFS